MFKTQRTGAFLCLLGAFFVLNAATAAEKTLANPPAVPDKFVVGMKKFQTLCAACHGKWGKGSKLGPPFIHPFYKPSHHNDGAFYRAVLKGVRAHHWNFGNMPQVAGVNKQDIGEVIAFIRWLQQENKLY